MYVRCNEFCLTNIFWTSNERCPRWSKVDATRWMNSTGRGVGNVPVWRHHTSFSIFDIPEILELVRYDINYQVHILFILFFMSYWSLSCCDHGFWGWLVMWEHVERYDDIVWLGISETFVRTYQYVRCCIFYLQSVHDHSRVQVYDNTGMYVRDHRVWESRERL